MSQFNQFNVNNLSADQFILRGQRWNLDGAIIDGVPTTALTTEVIINDDTKNQVLFTEIYGNIHGNTFPKLQAEIDALEANVALLQAEDINLQNQINAIDSNVIILQGNVVSLQDQIYTLTGNVVINANAIAELINDTQFLEAPYAGLAGNTSFFWRGLQVYNTPTDAINEATDNGFFSYLDGGAPASQIQLRVQDTKNVFIKGSTTITTPANGLVSIGGNSSPMTFNVGNSGNNNAVISMNGNINLNGDSNTRVSVYTKSVLLPIPSTIKTAEMYGADEANVLGKKVTAKSDDGAQVVLTTNATMSGTSATVSGTTATLSGAGGSVYSDSGGSNVRAANGKGIDIQCVSGSSNSTINIGTQQDLTDTGYTTINIGNSNSLTLRTSSTFLDGDTYLPKIPINPAGWDNLTYIGLPTPFSGPTHGPLKSTFNPYIRSISAFCPEATANSFFQSSGTFTVNVGLGAIALTTGTGGMAITCIAGLFAISSLIGGVGITTAGGAIALTTGAGIIQMTTGAAPIAMETNIGDILLKAGYSYQSTPELSLGSVYIQARDYSYITPDKGVIVGEGIVTPFNETLINTMNYPFSGYLFSNAFIPNLTGVFSNTFQTPNSTTTLLNPITSNLIYSNVAFETGTAIALLRNMDINGTIATSSTATVPAGNLGANVAITNTTTNFYFPDNTILPLNANVSVFVYIPDTPNIAKYSYSTWQANANIAGNISALVSGYVEPLPPSYENYMTVLGNVGILSELDVGANITVASSSFPLQKTVINRNSIITTGDITCSTLNYTTLNPPIVIPNISGGVDSIIAGTNISISPLNGQGNVVINCTLPNISGVSQIIAGNGIEISPLIGTGNVIVSLAGSVIPPGGYLPISGGTMSGSIYQFPSSNLVASNTIKKYRPLTSYQPPFPSISTPTFTGEQLTFFNGDNSPEQLNFTGWFPENMFQYQPDVITGNIPGGPNTFYSFVGGTNQAISGGNFRTQINQFANGDHITGGSMTIVSADADQTKLTLSIFSQDPGGAYNTLYQTSIPSLPTGGGTYSIPIDYTYTGGQTGQNTLVFSFDPRGDGSYPAFTIVGASLGGNLYNFEGQLNLAGVGQSSHYIGVQADPTASGFYEYFPTTNLLSKLGAVYKQSGGVAKINGIYYDDVATSRTIIVYGDFNGLTSSSGTTYTFNNIFMYNVDTGVFNALSTQTADPAYSGNLPKGLNGQVWGVEKQSSTIFTRQVWIWGDFTGVAQMGNPNPPIDVPLINSSIGYTFSDNWAVAISWGNIVNGTKLTGCRGGSIANDNPASPQSFALMVWATNRGGSNFRTISIVYYDTGVQSSTAYPFGNGNFGNPALTTNVVTRIDKVAWRAGPSLVYDQLVFCGSYIGVAQGAGNVDVPCYSLSSTQTTDNSWNPLSNPPWGQGLKILGRSGDASFWYPNNILMGSTTYKVCTNGTINETAVIGTTGYSSLSTNGGGVLTMNNNDFFVSTPTVNKFLITGVSAYSVKNIIGIDPTAINLSCSLDEDNFWWGQTFNSTISPAPTPPTIPTIVAINGAKFLVNNTEMDKIVFSGGDTDFSSVSFIAGSVEKGDPYWYWQSQVGALDYYAGNVVYPNITATGSAGNSGVYTAGENITINGNVISVSNPLTSNLNIASVKINGNSLGQLNMTLDSTGLNQIDNFTDSSNLNNLSLILIDNTNQRQAQLGANGGLVIADLSGNLACEMDFQNVQIANTISGDLMTINPSQLQTQNIANSTVAMLENNPNPRFYLSNGNNNFQITKSGFDTNITQSSVFGNINIQTPDIVSITSQNAVEIGTPQRRQLNVAVELQNTGTLTGSNTFPSPGGVIDASGFTITQTTTITNISIATEYNDGSNGNSNISISLMENFSGVETSLFSVSQDTSGGSLQVLNVAVTGITINPDPAKYYFIRLTVPIPIYSYYGVISDGLTPWCVVSGTQLQQVSDPIEYFNVYGNSFFQDNMLIHANLTVADPSNEFFRTVLEHNYIQLFGETFNTQIGPGSTYITNGINQQVQQATFLQVKRTDITRQATLNNGSLAFIEGANRTATYSPFTCDINSTSGPIARGTLSTGSLTLNHNDTGGVITLNKDSITTAGTVISQISSFARDASNVSREFNRISSIAQNVGASNQDGTLQFQCLVNGTFNTIMTLNGSSQEIEVGKNIDMNGNDLRTSSGNLTISATLSSGVGHLTLEPKSATGDLIFNGTNIQSATSGGNSGQHLRIKLNGVYYKIALQADT